MEHKWLQMSGVYKVCDKNDAAVCMCLFKMLKTEDKEAWVSLHNHLRNFVAIHLQGSA